MHNTAENNSEHDMEYDEMVYDGTPWGGAEFGWTPSGEEPEGVADLGAPLIARTTVVALSSAEIGPDARAVVASVAELAVDDELVVAYAHAESAPSRMNPYSFVAALRVALPRHKIIAVLLDADPLGRSTEYVVLRELLQDGSVAVAAVATFDPDPVAIDLAEQLAADRVLRLTNDPVHGVQFELLWTAQPQPTSEAA
jgi:hypothetical protein